MEGWETLSPLFVAGSAGKLLRMQSYLWIGLGGVLRAKEDMNRFLHRRVVFLKASDGVDFSAHAGEIRSPRGAVVDT